MQVTTRVSLGCDLRPSSNLTTVRRGASKGSFAEAETAKANRRKVAVMNTTTPCNVTSG